MKKLLRKQKQIIFFVIAGALSAVVEIGAFKILSVIIPDFFEAEKNFLGIHYPFSNIFSTTIAIIFNYYLSIWFVFERGKHSKRREFAYFMTISFITTLLSLFFFQIFYSYVFKDNFDVRLFTFSPEMISKIAAILLVSMINYTVKKKIIFNG